MVRPILFILHLFTDVCVWGESACVRVCMWRSEDNWETRFPSLTTWVLENPTQVVRVGTKLFSPLSHPADFLVNYFIHRKNK